MQRAEEVSLESAASGGRLGTRAARALARVDVEALAVAARERRDGVWPGHVTFSPKVFLPLTRLCRDVCHYCTFATTPSRLPAPYLDIDSMLDIASAGRAAGCHEVLFTLGDRPEARWRVAREWLAANEFSSTVHYLAHAAARIRDETGLLPHVNAGVLDAREYASLRAVSASAGLMLESVARRLCARGGVHHGSPDKHPALRLASIRAAGEARVPFTSGLLIGIGETLAERIDALLALRRLHERYGHLQEVIVQNFVPKPGTAFGSAHPATLDELRQCISLARLILPPDVHVQAPPNLRPDGVGSASDDETARDEHLDALLASGIDDFGGVSPLTPDHVNPESPWPARSVLEAAARRAGRALVARLPVYPEFARGASRWLAPEMRASVLRAHDAEGYAREDNWVAGSTDVPPPAGLTSMPDKSACAPGAAGGPHRVVTAGHRRRMSRRAGSVAELLDRCARGEPLSPESVARLLAARGDAAMRVVSSADALRRSVCGDTVSFVVNRNINYTNVCTFACAFCAFSKSSARSGRRERAYRLDLDTVVARCAQAQAAGATEVCLQGGIHSDYDGNTYLDIVRAIRSACPTLHIHAFSPLEVTHGAETLGLGLEAYLERLADAGLGSLPGTAAEILDDEVRAEICPDKLDTGTWLGVMRAAHRVGLRSTATMMFGHVDNYRHQANHLLALRELQAETGGFTEFVPLPFVSEFAPVYRRGRARRGPTWREVVLVHAVARLVLHPLFRNVQASWVKLGAEGLAQLLDAGVNDLGGTLMNESITRAAGASHGQSFDADAMQALAAASARPVVQRTTLYGDVVPEARAAIRGVLAATARSGGRVVAGPALSTARGGA